MTPTECFICERPVKDWRPPYVELGTDGYGHLAWAHFVCYQNARSPVVTDEDREVTVRED